MDELDLKIVNYLIEKHTTKYNEMAREFGTNSTTIYERIKKLKANGVLLGIYPNIDLSKFGYDFTCFIQLNIDAKSIPEIVKKYGARHNVVSIFEITGAFDLMFIAKFKSTKELYEMVKELGEHKAVEKIEPMVAYTAHKEGINPFPLTLTQPFG